MREEKMLLILFNVVNLNVMINALLISIGKMIPLTMTALADEELEESPLWHFLPSSNIVFCHALLW